ncbi:MAG: hypothetical protein QOG80_1822, partial [Pseudonocardiales bacterium]|nr:hypothetical protein [Pseudonocardiales bacterium]
MTGHAVARRLDLRLTLGAVAAWSALLCCLDWNPRGCLWAGFAAAAGGVGLALRRARWAQSGALCAFCVGLVLVPLAARQHLDRVSPLTALAGRHAVVTVELVTT